MRNLFYLLAVFISFPLARAAAAVAATDFCCCCCCAPPPPPAPFILGEGSTKKKKSPVAPFGHVCVGPPQKPSAAARPIAVEKEGPGPLPTKTGQLARTPKKAKPSAATRPSAAEKEGSGVFLTTTKHSTPARRRRPSAAARPSAAEKGGWGIFSECYSSIRPCAKEAKCSDHAALALLFFNAKPKQEQTQRDLPSARQRDVSYALIFSRIRAQGKAAPEKVSDF
jgi:hypothetical protein